MKTRHQLIGICSDHAGFEKKEVIKAFLTEAGIEVKDFGCYAEERCDYPDFAHKLGQAIDEGSLQTGIAVCGSGNGISMALNKHSKVRAALSWSKEIAELARLHNDANVLSLPGRFLSSEEVRGIVEIFLTTDFEGDRHVARVNKIPL